MNPVHHDSCHCVTSICSATTGAEETDVQGRLCATMQILF